MLTTPSGTPASSISSPQRSAGSGVCSAGFSTTVFPHARAGATFQLIAESGPFQGMIGKLILQASAGNLKRVSLELGGKSPNVVFADAEMEQAVALSASGVFRNQGQVCCAATRTFVQELIYEEFAERIAAKANEIKLGQPLDPATTMGPLVSRNSMSGCSATSGWHARRVHRRRPGASGVLNQRAISLSLRFTPAPKTGRG